MKSTTQLLAWNDYLKTGIEIVDQQHRGLIDLANETAAKLSSGEHLNADEMRTLLGFLADYAATHFSTEETLMALGGIDEGHIAHHRQSHANFLRQVNEMVGELADGTLTGQQLMEFLGNWLIYHMLGEDQKLSALLRNASGATEAEVSPGAGVARSPDPFAQEAANRSLSKLYAFMAERNEQLRAAEQAQRDSSQQMMDMVAKQTAALAASEERFRVLFHDGALPIVISRLEPMQLPGLIVDANPAACEILGYEPEELRKLTYQDLLEKEEISRFPLLIAELQVTGRFECEMTLLTKAGLRLQVHIGMAQFVLQGQAVLMTVIQQISTQRNAELAEGSIQQLARHLAEVRSGFLAGIAPRATDANRRLLDASFDEAMGPTEIEAFIAAQPLFQSISSANQALLAKTTRARCLRRGELLFEKGDKPAGLFYVVKGHILLGVSSLQGDTKVMGIYGVGHSIGEAEIAMASPYPYFAESVGDAVVLEIAQAAFLTVLDTDANFARSLICSMGLRQHDLLFSVESYSLRTATERVIGYLLQHARVQASGCLMVKLPATKQLIASLLNIKPETLSRIFRDLSDAGLIEVMVLQVEIFDLDRLIAYHS